MGVPILLNDSVCFFTKNAGVSCCDSKTCVGWIMKSAESAFVVCLNEQPVISKQMETVAKPMYFEKRGGFPENLSNNIYTILLDLSNGSVVSVVKRTIASKQTH